MPPSEGTHQSGSRGVVLLEILLSIALFVGVAAFVLSSLRMSAGRMDDAFRLQQAADFAASKLAELEAGIISLEDLRDGNEPLLRDTESEVSWVVSLQTAPTPYGSLVVVELTVAQDDDPRSPQATVRKLMRLRKSDRGEDGQ